MSNLVVAPTVTTSYRLEATNESAAVSAELTVRVNPRACDSSISKWPSLSDPVKHFVVLGCELREDDYISPAIGDVTARTVNGVGEVEAQPAVTTSYL